MFKSDLEKLSDSLDEHIIKALKPSRVSKVAKAEQEISKSLSHNPFEPVEMGVDSPYYSPYQLNSDGYLPFPVEYWEGQGKSRDGYGTTIQMYESFKNFKRSRQGLSDLMKSLDVDLVKAGAVPIGTVHTYRDGQRYKKIADGKWEVMAGVEKPTVKNYLGSEDPKRQDMAHSALEGHASSVQKIKEFIDKKTKEDSFKHATTQGAVQETMGHVKKILSKLFDGPLPPELEQHIEDAISGKSKADAKAGEAKDSEPKAESLPAEEQTIMKEVEQNLGAGTPHKVVVGFTLRGKKYEHEFPNVMARSPEKAQNMIQDEMKQHLGAGVQFNKFHAEKLKNGSNLKGEA